MIIGICGKSGSGKSTLAKRIIKLTDGKAIHLDIDKVGHDVLLLPDVINDLKEVFGDSIITNGCVNRKALGNIVFASKEKMAKLSDITWKYMQIEIDKFIDANKDKAIILDWILLPVSKYFDMCNKKILLDIPFDIRKQRAIIRDGITGEDFDLREQGSILYDTKAFDYILKDNNYEEIERTVRLL